MHKTRRHPLGGQTGRRRAHHCKELRSLFGAFKAGQIRVIAGDRMIDQGRDPVGRALIGMALECAETDMGMLQPGQHRPARGRGFVMTGELIAGLEHAKGFRGIDAQRFEHFCGENFPHRAFQRQAAIAGARPRRPARSLGAEVQQAAGRIAHLGIEKAAAIADLRIVMTELVAVIAHGQRRMGIAVRAVKAAKMTGDLIRCQLAEAYFICPAFVPPTQLQVGKIGRIDRVGEIGPQKRKGGFRREAHAVRPARKASAASLACLSAPMATRVMLKKPCGRPFER